MNDKPRIKIGDAINQPAQPALRIIVVIIISNPKLVSIIPRIRLPKNESLLFFFRQWQYRIFYLQILICLFVAEH